MFIYFLFALLIVSSFLVILSRDSVQSIFFLILVFLISIMFFLLLGAEFLALFILIVYVGAISILFLFIVMLLNLRIVDIYNTLYNFLPVGLFIGLIFIFELSFLINFFFCKAVILKIFFEYNNFVVDFCTEVNIIVIGNLLYNYCIHLFLVA